MVACLGVRGADEWAGGDSRVLRSLSEPRGGLLSACRGAGLGGSGPRFSHANGSSVAS